MPRATTGLSYMTLSLVLLGSLVFIVFVVVPEWNALTQARDQLQLTQKDLGDKQQFLANIDKRKAELKQYAQDNIALSVALPDRPVTAETLAVLQHIASGSGATVTDVATPTQVTQATTGPVPVTQNSAATSSVASIPQTLQAYDTTVKVQGTYPQIRSFVGDLEKSLLLTDIQSVKLSSGQDVTQQGGTAGVSQPQVTTTGELTGDLVLRTYVQQTKPEGGN